MLKAITRKFGISWAWESSPQYLAQVGHCVGGWLIVFILGVFSHDRLTIRAFAIGVILAGVKETFDTFPPPWGEADSIADSIMDWAFWVLGGLFGLATMALAIWRHCLVLP